MKTTVKSGVVSSFIIFVIFLLTSCNNETTDLPSVKTIMVTDVTYFAASVTVEIKTNDESPITERGICWSTNTNPSMSDNVIRYSGKELKFSCEIKNLVINTNYNVRAYAVNKNGTSYGENLPFKTLDESTLPVSVAPLLVHKWTVFTWPYNAYYPLFTGKNNVNGRLAAPCGPTTLSRVLGYWGNKIKATGKVDALTSNQTVRFTVDLDTININYSNLPLTLSSYSSSMEIKDVAKLFLMAGAVGLTNYMDVATPGDSYIAGLKKYFKVSPDVHFAKRWEYSKEDWIQMLKKELAYGRPVMIAARKSTSPKPWENGNVEGHWFNIEGYDAQDRFYIDYNYQGAGFRGYYDVDDFGEYNSYGLAVIGFKPL